jgi:dTDP-4-amino-4,6-dideoxy-D-galactose acyltransferase
MTTPCEYLGWDSSFFGRRIGRLGVGRLTAATLIDLDDWVAANQIECVYFLCETPDPESTALAEGHGFHLVDIRVTLENRSGGDRIATCGNLRVREASSGHVEALKAIARSSHKNTRFYQDTHFEASRCDALYETWIEKSCSGYADMVLTVELGETVAGYITCHLDSERAGHIGLLAVADTVGGKGVGSALVHAALNWFRSQQRSLVTVVTQGSNIRAQRLYQRCGFVSCSVELWYHYWPAS